MHSREPIRPSCQSLSIACQEGSANCSKRKSVASRGTIVPSKLTKTWHFTRARDTYVKPIDGIAAPLPNDKPGPRPLYLRTAGMPISFVHIYVNPHLSVVPIDRDLHARIDTGQLAAVSGFAEQSVTGVHFRRSSIK